MTDNNDDNNKYMSGGCTGKGWQKGQSGNPHGRPPLDPKIKEILTGAAPEAAQLQADMLHDDKIPIKLRLQAAENILNRAYGKPIEHHDDTLDANLTVTMSGDVQRYAK